MNVINYMKTLLIPTYGASGTIGTYGTPRTSGAYGTSVTNLSNW